METEPLLKQMKPLLDEYGQLKRTSRNSDLSDHPKDIRSAIVSRSVAAIKRISGPNSTYSMQLDSLLEREPYVHLHIHEVFGILLALYRDVEAGFIGSIIELIHSDIFSEYIEMAVHLNANGYKDPAAVIAGSTLENHLKNLCDKHSIQKIVIKSDGTTSPKKAETLNSELVSQAVYSKLDQKSVTAWLDLRNKAAHGQYAEYTSEQVNLMINGIRDLILRKPA